MFYKYTLNWTRNTPVHLYKASFTKSTPLRQGVCGRVLHVLHAVVIIPLTTSPRGGAEICSLFLLDRFPTAKLGGGRGEGCVDKHLIVVPQSRNSIHHMPPLPRLSLQDSHGENIYPAMKGYVYHSSDTLMLSPRVLPAQTNMDMSTLSSSIGNSFTLFTTKNSWT